jgi:ubiquitin C-terminal hydrolase
MKLGLDKNINTFLRNLTIGPNIEFECRFGLKKDVFLPRISKEKFDKLQLQLKSQYLQYNYEESTVTIYENNIREINTNGLKRYETKNKLSHSDTEYNDFTLRLSLAKESPLDQKPFLDDLNKKEIRKRKRHIFNYKNIYEYVLTELQNFYEFEIEYNLNEIRKNVNYYFNESIEKVLPILVSDIDNPIYIPIPQQKYIRYLFKNEEIIETKPINLPRHVTPDLYSLDYTITNKLDGERFYIFFCADGLYAINKRKVRKISNDVFSSVTVLDTEYFNNIYYIFDCLIYKGDSLIHKSELYDRIKEGKFFENFMPKLFKVKEFKRAGKEKNSLEYYAKKLLNQDRENNDGLIFTPSDFLTDMSPIYKWKYPSKMSIDFMIHKIYENNGITTYHLYVKGEGGKLYPYIIDGLKEAIFQTKEKLKDSGIYEFTYDKENDKFNVLRERTDKTDPNYITVADNVWEDMKNPFTEEELIKLLYPPPLRTYRIYQNNIKKDLISKYCQGASILDLGSGRGGDLGKYDKAKIDQLWCVEPNEKNYTELLNRLEERPNIKQKTKLIIGTAQDTEKITKSIRDTLNIVNMPYTEMVISADFRDWFPKKKGIDYSKLIISDEGLYSMTKHIDSEIIIDAIKSVVGESLNSYTITDSTANVGGDSIRFAMNFKSVNSVEIDKSNYDVLKNNLSVYNFDNVNLYNNDITIFWKELANNTDILFIDPPWGGKDYLKESKINLFLGESPLNNFLGKEVLLNPNRPYYIFLKVPVNYNLDLIQNLPNVYDIQIFKIRKFYLICLCVDNDEIPLKKVNIVSSFMSLSFFFNKDEKGNYPDLDKLVNTISKTLQNGGYFIGTTIDGDTTYSLLNSTTDKKLKYDSGYIRLTENENEVEIKMEEGIVETQLEHLVDFNLLVKKLSAKNINIVSSRFFDKPIKKNRELYDTLSTSLSETKLNSLYRSFVFIKNKPEELFYTKAMKYMDMDMDMDTKTYNITNIFNKLSSDSFIPGIKFDIIDNNESFIRNKCFKLFTQMSRNVFYEDGNKNSTFEFNYIDENDKFLRYKLSGKIDSLNNQMENYVHGKKLDKLNIPNILKTYAIIKLDKSKETLFISEASKTKSKTDISSLLCSNEYEKIISCLYQLYFTIYCIIKNGIYPVDPIIEIDIDKSIDIISYPYDLGDIKVIDGYIVKIKNFSPSMRYRYETLYMIDNPKDLSLDYIDIITKLPSPFKNFIYNELEKSKECYDWFYFKMLNYENLYDTNKTIKIRIDSDKKYNKDLIYNPNKHLSIKDELDKDQNRINLLDDDQYKYYKKYTKYLYKNTSEIRDILTDRELVDYKSNEIKIYTDNIDNIDNIEINYKIVENKADLYIYNSDIFNILDIPNIIDIQNIPLKSSLIIKSESYFSIDEMQVLGFLSNIFDKVHIVKPINSHPLNNEIFIVCNNLNNLKSKYKDYDNLTFTKYLTILLSSYEIYGRKLYLSDLTYKSFIALYNTNKNIDFVTKYNISSIGFSKYYYRFIKDIWDKEDKEIQNKKVNGMPNLGNTCYMNSSLQSLASFPQIQKYFCDKKNRINIKNDLLSAFSEIICELTRYDKSPITSTNLKKLKSNLVNSRPDFIKGQHDAEDFIITLLNILHTILNKKDGADIRMSYDNSLSKEENIENALISYKNHNDSVISKLFTILWKSTLECKECKNQRSYIETSFQYNLSLPERISDFKEIISSPNIEILSDDNMVYCSSCLKKTDHIKKLEALHFPLILIITLVRFKGLSKNELFVDYPLNIENIDLKDRKYSLQSIVNHYGTLKGGHYTSFGKVDKNWYEYNDETALEINTDKVVNKNAYILFYGS